PTIDRAFGILSIAIAHPSRHAGQDFDSFVDCGDGVDAKLAGPDRLDDVGPQHEIAQVRARNHDALSAGQAFQPANVVVAFDFLIDAADRLNFAVLVDRPGHRDPLRDWNPGEARQ